MKPEFEYAICKQLTGGRVQAPPAVSKARQNIKQLCDMVNALAGSTKVQYKDFIEGVK